MFSRNVAFLVAILLVFGGGVGISLLCLHFIGWPRHLIVSMPISGFLGWKFVDISNLLTKKEEDA